MGGAFSKKGSKRDKDPRTQDKQNRRLSVSGIAQGPQGDSNTVTTCLIHCDFCIVVILACCRPERSQTVVKTSTFGFRLCPMLDMSQMDTKKPIRMHSFPSWISVVFSCCICNLTETKIGCAVP